MVRLVDRQRRDLTRDTGRPFAALRVEPVRDAVPHAGGPAHDVVGRVVSGEDARVRQFVDRAGARHGQGRLDDMLPALRVAAAGRVEDAAEYWSDEVALQLEVVPRNRLFDLLAREVF